MQRFKVKIVNGKWYELFKENVDCDGRKYWTHLVWFEDDWLSNEPVTIKPDVMASLIRAIRTNDILITEVQNK